MIPLELFLGKNESGIKRIKLILHQALSYSLKTLNHVKLLIAR